MTEEEKRTIMAEHQCYGCNRLASCDFSYCIADEEAAYNSPDEEVHEDMYTEDDGDGRE